MGILRRQRRRRIIGAALVGGAIARRTGRNAQNNAQPEPEEEQAQEPESKGLDKSKMDELEKLGKLHADGILSDEEFASEKSKILDS